MKSATASSPKKTQQPQKAVVARTSSINAASAPEDSSGLNQMHKRSASFHYPDGSSRVTHSVYSSEEDFNDEDEDEDQEPRLYEVNEDELFLAYDSGGVVTPRRQKAPRNPPRNTNGSSSSTQSGSKLEALDNLVISTIFSVSTKLCVLSGKLVKSLQERTRDKDEEAMLETLVILMGVCSRESRMVCKRRARNLRALFGSASRFRARLIKQTLKKVANGICSRKLPFVRQ